MTALDSARRKIAQPSAEPFLTAAEHAALGAWIGERLATTLRLEKPRT